MKESEAGFWQGVCAALGAALVKMALSALVERLAKKKTEQEQKEKDLKTSDLG